MKKKKSGATIKKYMVIYDTWDSGEAVEIIEARSKGQAKYFCYKKHFNTGISGKGLSFGMYLEVFRPEAKEIKP